MREVEKQKKLLTQEIKTKFKFKWELMFKGAATHIMETIRAATVAKHFCNTNMCTSLS